MPLTNVVFHFWFIVEIVLSILIIAYMYGSNIFSYINLLFDSQFTSFQKIQKIIYEPILLITRMIEPQIDEHVLFWVFEIPIAIIIVTIFVIIPLLYDNIDIYKIINNIYRFIVGTRRNDYNFTQIKNNYGNYIPVLLVLIILFVVLNQIGGPIFSFVLVFLIYTFSYTAFNLIMFLSNKTNEIKDNTIKYSINDYIFIIIFILIWVSLITFILSSNKTILKLYKPVV